MNFHKNNYRDRLLKLLRRSNWINPGHNQILIFWRNRDQTSSSINYSSPTRGNLCPRQLSNDKIEYNTNSTRREDFIIVNNGLTIFFNPWKFVWDHEKDLGSGCYFYLQLFTRQVLQKYLTFIYFSIKWKIR